MEANVHLNDLVKKPAHLKMLGLLAALLLSLSQAEAIDPRANTPVTEGYIVGYNDPDPNKRPYTSGVATIYVRIGNRATATAEISAGTHISVYKGSRVSKESFMYNKTLAEMQYIIGSDVPFFGNSKTIKAGEEFWFLIEDNSFPIDPNETYVVRLADDSDTSPSTPVWRWGLNEDRDGTLADPNYGIGVVDYLCKDGDWPDQSVRVVGLNKYNIFADAQTVQDHQSVEIDIFGNDALPDDFFAGLQLPSTSLAITMQPKAGSLTQSGSGRDSRITYHHDGRAPLPDAVDSFEYSVTYNADTRYATVYIYVLQSATGGFSANFGATHTITLADKPQGAVLFNWFDASRGDYTGYGFSRTLADAITADSTYLVQPKIAPTPNPYPEKFPKGLLTISPTAIAPATGAVMRWTGVLDRNWQTPDNWVEVKDGIEMPTMALPTVDADVILPSGAANYPELTSPVVCRDIKLEDRAMIAGINHLTYRNAEVELKLKATEKDRFVMYAAPLQSAYSGDYHYTDGVKPVWGDVYMNLFQQANPDNSGSVATANMFTATFGNLATPLPLGKAFNLKVVANRMNKDSAFVFPQTAATYTYSDGKSTPALDRTDGNRFITDGAAWTKDTFDLPVYGGDAGSALIQVANPFMAYLDITAFLSGNSAVIGDSYKIWNGLPDKDIIDVYTGSPAIDGQRLIIVNADNIPKGNLTLIPPLQSFFVEKNDRQATVSSLTVSSAWATTQGDSPYTLLRSGAQPEERNLLRIKATQGNHTSSTLLCFDENASPAYCGAEDSRKLFFSEIPLSAYSLTPSREPLAINANGNYTANTALGLLMAEEGEVRLDFSGMATFGYDVYLIDNDRNGKAVETDLQKSPYYTFTAVKRSPSDAMIELNDRFSLRMEHRSTDTPAIPREASDWNVSTEDGIIRIRSAETITNLQIYNANGQLIYRTNAPSTSYEIRAPHQHLYIIKARIGETYKTRKIVGSEQ